MDINNQICVEKVKDTILRSCLFLDDEQWSRWLDLCLDNFQYKITSYSPEIRKDMIYFSGDHGELRSMTEMLPKHNTDHSPLKRHASVYTVDLSSDGAAVEAVTSVIIYQTMLDGINSHIDSGETRLFCAGRYIDTLVIEEDTAKFLSREFRLENRRLDKGSHWPL